MGQVWTREAWNALIRRVNDLCQHPDSGCESIEPLNEVAEKHIWTPDDIIAVRSKLVEICSENVFEAETVKWKQNIIDEIDLAIEAGWCNCCDPYADIGVTFNIPYETIYSPAYRTFIWDYGAAINDLQVGQPGVIYRAWRLHIPATACWSDKWFCGKISCNGQVISAGVFTTPFSSSMCHVLGEAILTIVEAHNTYLYSGYPHPKCVNDCSTQTQWPE